jgi:xylulokinase
VFLPYLQGERVPDLPAATGTLLGLRPGGLTPGRLYRAALEGTSLNLAWGLDRLRALGLDFEQVRVVGGGSRNELWCRILADTLGAPVQRLREPESAALGGALQAAWTFERQDDAAAQLSVLVERFVETEGEPFEPGEGVEAYAELGRRFRAEVERLYG